MKLLPRLLLIPITLLTVVSILPKAQANSTATVCIKNRLPFSFGGSLNLGSFGTLGINLSPSCSPATTEQNNQPKPELPVADQPAPSVQENSVQQDNATEPNMSDQNSDSPEEESPNSDDISSMEDSSTPTVE